MEVIFNLETKADAFMSEPNKSQYVRMGKLVQPLDNFNVNTHWINEDNLITSEPMKFIDDCGNAKNIELIMTWDDSTSMIDYVAMINGKQTDMSNLKLEKIMDLKPYDIITYKYKSEEDAYKQLLTYLGDIDIIIDFNSSPIFMFTVYFLNENEAKKFRTLRELGDETYRRN